MFALILASVLGQFSDTSAVPVTGKFPITYNGVHFEAYGSADPDKAGSILWDKNYKPNVRAYNIAKEAPKADQVDRTPNYGLEPGRMWSKGEKVVADSARAKRFYDESQGQEGGSTKLHVTVVGTDAERKVVLDDLAKHPAFAALRPSLLIQDYEPGQWAVDPTLGFQPGTPAIIVQQGKTPADPKGGKVIYRTTDYAIGPDALAEELRKASPDYKPHLDPSPTSPKHGGCPLGFTHEMLPVTAAAVALIVFLVLAKPRKV